jgi:hypothetical protein
MDVGADMCAAAAAADDDDDEVAKQLSRSSISVACPASLANSNFDGAATAAAADADPALDAEGGSEGGDAYSCSCDDGGGGSAPVGDGAMVGISIIDQRRLPCLTCQLQL